MRTFVTFGSVLAVVLAVAVIPAASAQRQAEPPAACAGLVDQLATTLKAAVEPLAAKPPTPDKAVVPLGDSLRVLVGLTAAKCLPTPPMSAPAEVRSPDVEPRGPELCLSRSMATFAGLFSVLSKIVPGAVAPDAGKLRGEVQNWLKTVNDTVSTCGLPAPPGGMPTLPNPPA
ncbi:hypothetical protein LZG04_38235 [Saccharothrix sp. S26]|uniref:hypothetical protein n=1 Tax=Saccharothrix sp. S26 TaxID=2907215 RepID=UPI001F3417F2|nr:hypothetical protein [Saccharothrix sp. S26]MCE7000614.1 hypothetical protein [Saccharothrix sp. S26]